MIRIKKILLLCLLPFATSLFAQRVISSASSSDFVFGETFVGTYTSNKYILTQGFLQGIIEVAQSGVNDEVVNPDVAKWNLYPNPLKSILNISYLGNKAIENCVLNIYSVSGTLVYSATVSCENQAMDLSILAAGIYNITIINSADNSIIQSNKIIKH